MAAEQTTLNEGIKNTNEELSDKMVALLESHLTFHGEVNSLGEKTSQIVSNLAGVVAEQAAVKETLQAHAEVSNSQMSALAARHGQLDTNVNSLQELAQTLGDSITDVSNEQAALHRSLRDNTQGLTDNIRTVEQNQKTLQSGICGLDEKAAQMAAEQTALNEGIKNTNEELSGKMVALSDNQQTLQATVQSLNEKTNHTVEEVTALAAEQASVGEALHRSGHLSDRGPCSRPRTA